MHYIISKFSAEPTKLGKLKLAKIFWFCEREFMYKNYSRLSDTDFIRMPLGPVPDKYDTALKELEQANKIHIFQVNHFSYKQICFHSLEEPDLSPFNVEEIHIIDSVIYALKDKSARELTELTHDSLWENTKEGDIMPIESVFSKDLEPPTLQDIEWANNL